LKKDLHIVMVGGGGVERKKIWPFVGWKLKQVILKRKGLNRSFTGKGGRTNYFSREKKKAEAARSRKQKIWSYGGTAAEKKKVGILGSWRLTTVHCNY